LSGALVVTALSFCIVPPAYRVLADETNLISTSLSLSLDRSLNNIIAMMHVTDDRLQIVQQSIATRPALFPFLVAHLHLLFGYHACFGFVVNFFVGVTTLVVIVFIGRELFGLTYGVLAAALLAAFPLYTLVVTSAGFDALNACLFLTLFLCAIRF